MIFTKHGRKMLFGICCAVIAFGLMVASATALKVIDMGKEDILMPGGTRGNVHFPHHVHQDILKECDICHSVFPQVPGSIEELKAKGTLKQKQVMNTLCIKCHRDRKRQGLEAGPTTCSKCHSSERR